ncbi:sigma-70 family RNA polymerase sigma factor [Umezawaea tangerina]|uniref:sigma-70 family RNA polymerase sigma factor n=1 Tax=Umezawaea tangerina TaxID=84725 RepID=UPI00147567D0|nr:sigma-70 family RNA polymerase sigma factor [Umezawaea tangerina]
MRTGDATAARAELDRALVGAPGAGTTDHPPSDADLVAAVRGGTTGAYGELYARHVAAARNLARQLARSPMEADDLVSEAFAKVLSVLRTGGGPDSAFRAYLLTALRHTAYDRTRRERRLDLVEDVEALPSVAASTSLPFHDTAVARLDQSLAARAFASLPENWQTVLWHTEIEGQTPAQVAPLLGLTANGVSALAYRAREGLRKAYLQAHVERNPSERCTATAAKLGAWTRGGLPKRDTAQVEAHLDGCAACRALTAELADVNGALRGVVAPLVLGVGTAGYLAAGSGKAGAVVSLGVSTPQWLGAAASAALLAVAIGAGVDVPDAPATVAQPPVSTTTTVQTTSPTGQTTSSAPAATTTTQPTTSTTEPTSAAPSGTAAATPVLTSTGPDGFTMSTGGPPTDFPLTIRNTGTAPAPPPTMTMSLPDDIHVVGPGNNLRRGSLVGLDGATRTVGCPAGKGTVVCTAPQELAPGDSVTFVFRLLAGPKAGNGTITATTDSVNPLLIEVPVTVKPKK